MFLFSFLLALLPFQSEMIPGGFTSWDYRAPATEISLRPLERGERVFLIASLPDSYEQQILEEIGVGKKALSIPEWKEILRGSGHRIVSAEVRHEVASFQGLSGVVEWLRPTLSRDQTEAFINVLQKRGWLELGDEKIGLPYKRVVFVLE